MAYRTEEEQLEVFRNWWKENGTNTLIAAVLVIGAALGVSQWQRAGQAEVEAASDLYQDWLMAHQKAGSAAASEPVQQLLEEYSDTFYGQAVLLFLAKEQVEQGDLEAAEAHLSTLIDRADSDDLSHIARLRSARVLYALQRYPEALARLKDPISTAYWPLYAELRGDIYMAQGNTEKAREAYQNAMGARDQEAQRQLDVLQMKLINAGGSPVQLDQ